jgi:hypothetical protein
MDFVLRSHPSSSPTFIQFESEFSENPRRQFANEISSAVVAMEFAAPPV